MYNVAHSDSYVSRILIKARTDECCSALADCSLRSTVALLDSLYYYLVYDALVIPLPIVLASTYDK